MQRGQARGLGAEFSHVCVCPPTRARACVFVPVVGGCCVAKVYWLLTVSGTNRLTDWTVSALNKTNLIFFFFFFFWNQLLKLKITIVMVT